FRLYAKPEMSDPEDVIDAELEAEDLPHLHSVRKALHWAGHLWQYLAKRWLRLVAPTDDPNRGWWLEHPTWAALRGAFPKLALRGAPELPEEALPSWCALRATAAIGGCWIAWRWGCSPPSRRWKLTLARRSPPMSPTSTASLGASAGSIRCGS